MCRDLPVCRFKNCQLPFPCVYRRESAAARTCTQTKPDSMLPRYYVASCTVNFEWLRSYRQLCSGLPWSQTCSELHSSSYTTRRTTEESWGCSRRTPPLARLWRAAQQKTCKEVNEKWRGPRLKKKEEVPCWGQSCSHEGQGGTVHLERRNDDVSGLLDIYNEEDAVEEHESQAEMPI